MDTKGSGEIHLERSEKQEWDNRSEGVGEKRGVIKKEKNHLQKDWL